MTKKVEEAIEGFWAVEYSVKQNRFHFEPLLTRIKRNQEQMIDQKVMDYQPVSIEENIYYAAEEMKRLAKKVPVQKDEI